MKQVIRKSTVLIGAMILTGCAGLKDVDHKWCPPEQQGTVENISLKADALFKFDKSSAQDMLPKGVAELNELAAKHDGGGHALASGANAKDMDEVKQVFAEVVEVTKKFKEDHE